MDSIHTHYREVWWLLMVRGLALILFGVVAVLLPGLTLLALATAFAVFLLISGVVSIVRGISAVSHRSLWFLTLLLGFIEVGVGVYLLKNHYSLAAFIAIIGLTLIVLGILEVIAAFEPGEDAGRRFLTIVVGALSLVAGFIVLRYPASSGLTFAWVLGVWGLIAGAMQVAMCLSLHSAMTELERH